MEQHSAEVWVKVISVWSFVAAAGSALLAILGFFMFLGGAMIAGGMETGDAETDALAATGVFGLVAAFGIVIVVIAFAFAVLYIIRGVGLWKHRNWARIITIVMAWIIGVLNVLMLLMSLVVFDIVSVLMYLVVTVICAAELWLLQFEPTVKGLFAK